MKKVICISGKAGAGKDTTALYMKDYLESKGYKVLICHYADLLKFICKNFFGWNGEKDEHGRSLLQHIGTDIVRSIDKNYWVAFINEILCMFEDEWDYAIIPDARFENEISYLKTHGHTVIHIRKLGSSSNLFNDIQKNHPSETSMDNIEPDYTIPHFESCIDLCTTVWSMTERNILNS